MIYISIAMLCCAFFRKTWIEVSGSESWDIEEEGFKFWNPTLKLATWTLRISDQFNRKACKEYYIRNPQSSSCQLQCWIPKLESFFFNCFAISHDSLPDTSIQVFLRKHNRALHNVFIGENTSPTWLLIPWLAWNVGWI